MSLNTRVCKYKDHFLAFLAQQVFTALKKINVWRNIPTQVKSSELRPWRKKSVSSNGQTLYSNPSWVHITKTSVIFGLSEFQCRNKMHSCFQSNSTQKVYCIQLRSWRKTVVRESKSLWSLGWIKININCWNSEAITIFNHGIENGL